MKISISGLNFPITDAIRSKVEESVNAVLDNKSMKVNSVNVTADNEKNHFNVNVVVNAKNHDFISAVKDLDLYKGIDSALSKVEAQITKTIDKIQDHQAPPLRDR